MSAYSIPAAIAAGGCIGALARYYVSVGVTKLAGEESAFVGTLTVNLIGCFLIGVLATHALRSPAFSPTMQKCLITGLLGSLTTFSTFALDSVRLLQEGRTGTAFASMALNLAVGLLLVWLGIAVSGGLAADEAAG